MEQIDTSSKKDPMPEINEEEGEHDHDQSSSSDDSNEDQWEAKEKDDVPKKESVLRKKAVPDAAFKKVPEEDHSSSFAENEDNDYDYEIVTASQQEVDQKISKVLESSSESSEREEAPLPKRFRPAIKGMHHHNQFLF